MKLAHIPLRVATGAYILNSGLSKQNLEGEAAEGVDQVDAAAGKGKKGVHGSVPLLELIAVPLSEGGKCLNYLGGNGMHDVRLVG